MAVIRWVALYLRYRRILVRVIKAPDAHRYTDPALQPTGAGEADRVVDGLHRQPRSVGGNQNVAIHGIPSSVGWAVIMRRRLQAERGFRLALRSPHATIWF